MLHGHRVGGGAAGGAVAGQPLCQAQVLLGAGDAGRGVGLSTGSKRDGNSWICVAQPLRQAQVLLRAAGRRGVERVVTWGGERISRIARDRYVLGS